MPVEDYVLDGTLRCGAVRKDGSLCQQRAGHGTDHVGEGRCKFHGGASPTKHGLYSKVKGTLGEKIKAHEKNPDPLSLIPELSLTRALLEEWMEKSEYANLAKTLPGAVALTDNIRKIVDTIHKMQTRDLLTARELEMALAQIVLILREEVKDPERLARISTRLSTALCVPSIGRIEAGTGE